MICAPARKKISTGPIEKAYLERMMSSCFYTAQDWRKRAALARAKAEWVDDPDAKRTMLEIASGYDALAKMAEKGALRLVTV
jgi:hypothetical protein